MPHGRRGKEQRTDSGWQVDRAAKRRSFATRATGRYWRREAARMGMERACHLDGTDRNAESRAVVKSASTLAEYGRRLPLDAFLLVVPSPYWLIVVNLRAGIDTLGD